MNVKVELVDPADIDYNLGCFQPVPMRIRISNRAKGPLLACTLIHEVLHAVWYVQGLSSRMDTGTVTEEQVVDAVSNGLTQVMRDNPELFERISAVL